MFKIILVLLFFSKNCLADWTKDINSFEESYKKEEEAVYTNVYMIALGDITNSDDVKILFNPDLKELCHKELGAENQWKKINNLQQSYNNNLHQFNAITYNFHDLLVEIKGLIERCKAYCIEIPECENCLEKIKLKLEEFRIAGEKLKADVATEKDKLQKLIKVAAAKIQDCTPE